MQKREFYVTDDQNNAYVFVGDARQLGWLIKTDKFNLNGIKVLEQVLRFLNILEYSEFRQ